MHHDERWWPDPEAYDPSRFLPENAKARHRFAYLPFGAGQRVCIGMSFALMEGTLIAAMMAQRFTFELVPGHPVEPEATLTLTSIVTADGARHDVDTIISAIGYRYSRSLLVDRISGVGGQSLGQVWDSSPRAYLGSSVPGFPNMFILLGPNSIGLNSVIFSLESQIAYVMGALDTMSRQDVRRIEVRPEALETYVEEVDRRSEDTVWTTGGCKSYYLDDTGRQFAIYPGFVFDYRRRTRRFDPEPYLVS